MIRTITKKLTAIVLFSLLCISTTGVSQIYWDFGTTLAYPTSGIPANLSVDSLKRGNPFGTPTSPLITSVSVSSIYPGFSAGGNAGTPARTGALDFTVNAVTGSAFFEITLTPATGYYVDLSGITFGSRSTSTGPKKYSIRTSADAYATEVAGDTINTPASTWGLRMETFSVAGAANTPLTLRIYGYAGTGTPTSGTTNFRIDDVNLSATAVPSTGSPVTANFSATTACFGTATSFTDLSSSTAGTIIGWAWNFGDGSAVDLTQNPTHLYATGGSFSVTLTVSDNMFNTGSYTSSVFVDSIATMLSASVAGNVVTFTGSSNNGSAPYTHFIDYGDGSPTAPTPNSVHTYMPGTYTACLTGMSANACTDTSCVTFTILATGITNSSFAETTIYPNPSATGNITVDGISGKTSITVFNIIGKVVYSSEVSSSVKHIVDLSSEANGSYFIRIHNNDSTITKKITLNR
ncbi:MAG: PKD domain-containing protein [Bacteroidota bacterium]|nr:PKD domain-containing protein [Bacteroidota bacterium]